MTIGSTHKLQIVVPWDTEYILDAALLDTLNKVGRKVNMPRHAGEVDLGARIICWQESGKSPWEV